MLLLMEICCQPQGILSEEAVDEEELVGREAATDSHIDSNFSASARKLKKNMEDDIDGSRSFTPKNSNVFFGILIFINLIQEIGRCLLCDTKLDVDHDLAGRMGLCNFFTLIAVVKYVTGQKGQLPLTILTRMLEALKTSTA